MSELLVKECVDTEEAFELDPHLAAQLGLTAVSAEAADLPEVAAALGEEESEEGPFQSKV